MNTLPMMEQLGLTNTLEPKRGTFSYKLMTFLCLLNGSR